MVLCEEEIKKEYFAKTFDVVCLSDTVIYNDELKRGNVPETLTIINRYGYSENDTLVLKNYRICYEEE